MQPVLQTETDENLAARVARREESAFGLLVQRHSTRFFKVAYGVVLNPQDAEDVVQDAFLKLWNGKAQWQEGRNNKFTTWFYRVVYNQALDQLRRKPPFKVVMPDENHPSEDKAADEVVEAKQASMVVEQAMHKLPERQRTALMLVYKDELPQAECAEVMGISVKALESLLSRGKATLKEHLGKNDGQRNTDSAAVEKASATR